MDLPEVPCDVARVLIRFASVGPWAAAHLMQVRAHLVGVGGNVLQRQMAAGLGLQGEELAQHSRNSLGKMQFCSCRWL
jgi:hypothetical protein